MRLCGSLRLCANQTLAHKSFAQRQELQRRKEWNFCPRAAYEVRAEENEFDDVQGTKHKIDDAHCGVAVTCVLWARLPERAIIRRRYAELREYHRYLRIGRTPVLRLFTTAALIPRERIPAPKISRTSSISETRERTVSALLVRRGLAPFVF